MSWLAPNLPRQKHCFFDSGGGYSEGLYAGLNVSTKSGDDPSRVRQNLEKAAAYFGLEDENLHLLKQGVSNRVCYTGKPEPNRVEADGAVTDKPGVVLCIRTADCAPVLLADYENGVIGAAHAGWRGAFAGVIENTVALMVEKGACLENIAAAVGPCIGQKSYEVDDSFYRTFVEKDTTFGRFFADGRPGHRQFNLESFCVSRLKACGIGNISASGIDTFEEENGYYSFRRNTLRGLVGRKGDFPVEMSAIVL